MISVRNAKEPSRLQKCQLLLRYQKTICAISTTSQSLFSVQKHPSSMQQSGEWNRNSYRQITNSLLKRVLHAILASLMQWNAGVSKHSELCLKFYIHYAQAVDNTDLWHQDSVCNPGFPFHGESCQSRLRRYFLSLCCVMMSWLLAKIRLLDETISKLTNMFRPLNSDLKMPSHQVLRDHLAHRITPKFPF